METKICTKCKKELNIEMFNKDATKKNGIYSSCKSCNALYEKNRRIKNKESIKKYNKLYRDLNKEYLKTEKKKYYKENRDKFIERAKKWSNDNPEKMKTSYLNWKKNNPEKRKAHILVQIEVKKGTIIKPEFCQICNIKTSKLDAHHEDYTKPLDVIFICRKCHSKKHYG